MIKLQGIFLDFEKRTGEENMVKTDYTREDLIVLCEHAIVDEENWRNRDTAYSQMRIGACWALLKALCDFTLILEAKDEVATDERTIWLEVVFDGFHTFENGGTKKDKE